MVLSLLFQPRKLVQVVKLMREASRRGVPLDDLPPEAIAAALRPRRADPTRHGLVPDEDVVTTVPLDPSLVLARESALSGSWETAASVLADAGKDWDRRSAVVSVLADAAAHDETWLEAWAASAPESGDLVVVHAEALVRLAWQVRGSGWASEVTEAQAAGFHRLLTQAEEAAWHATRLCPADPTPWATLITLARGLSYDHDAFGRLWQELMARDPLHRVGHQQALQYWCAKWFGSDELMNDFAAAAAAQPLLASLPMRAAFEEGGNAWRSNRVRSALDTLLARLANADAVTPSVLADRGWAAIALVKNKRFTEAVDQFRLIGPYAGGQPWSAFGDEKLAFLQYRTEACKRA